MNEDVAAAIAATGGSVALGAAVPTVAWREALVIVKLETVIAWHRKGFRLL